jgi:hypothetical protein
MSEEITNEFFPSELELFGSTTIAGRDMDSEDRYENLLSVIVDEEL